MVPSDRAHSVQTRPVPLVPPGSRQSERGAPDGPPFHPGRGMGGRATPSFFPPSGIREFQIRYGRGPSSRIMR